SAADVEQFRSEVEALEAEQSEETWRRRETKATYALALSSLAARVYDVTMNLAAALGASGDEEEAMEVYFRAKTAHEDAESGWATMEGNHLIRLQGTSTPSYADVAMNIGDHLNELGKVEEAKELFCKAKEVYLAQGWERTLHLCCTLWICGVRGMGVKGQRREAQETFQEALSAYEKVVLGEESPQYAELLEDFWIIIKDLAAIPRT
ncbi:unnamed protein product, partial [Cladocopium goreaui]